MRKAPDGTQATEEQTQGSRIIAAQIIIILILIARAAVGTWRDPFLVLVRDRVLARLVSWYRILILLVNYGDGGDTC